MQIFLETDRLLLRRFTGADEDDLVALDADPEVMRYLNGGVPTSREHVRDVILPFVFDCYERYDGLGFWAAEEKSTGEFIGWFHFRPDPKSEGAIELGYRLRRSAWGRGYATEGSDALIRKGFTELGVERVTARTMTVNEASRRVMEKAGLTFVENYEHPAEQKIDGAEHGDVLYALTKAEWLAGAAQDGCGTNPKDS